MYRPVVDAVYYRKRNFGDLPATNTLFAHLENKLFMIVSTISTENAIAPAG